MNFLLTPVVYNFDNICIYKLQKFLNDVICEYYKLVKIVFLHTAALVFQQFSWEKFVNQSLFLQFSNIYFNMFIKNKFIP